MYTPLTREQYQKAIKSGFTPSDIIVMEKKRKDLENTENSGYFKSVADDYKRIAGELKSEIGLGAEQIQKGGILNTLSGLKTGALSAVGNVAEAAFSPILEAPGIKQGMEFVGKQIAKIPGVETVAEKANEFSQKHPVASTDIKNVLDTLMLGGGKAAQKPIGKALEKTGTVIEKSGLESANLAKQKFSLDLIKPLENKKVKLSQVGRTEELSGLFKKDVVVPTRIEQEIAKTVSEIAGISEKNTFQKNYNIIRDFNTTKAKQLVEDVSKYDFIIPKREVIARLNLAAVELEASPMIVGDAVKTANKLIEGAKKIINENAGKGSGLLKARKEFDNWVKSQKPKVFEATSENAFTVANDAIRGTLNNLLDEKAVNLGIKDSLKQQSMLYRALENVAPKAAEEANTQFGRLMQSVGKTLGTKNKIVQGIAAAAGIGGLGAAATFAPAAAVLGGTGFALFKFGRLVLNPQIRIMLGQLLKKYGKFLTPQEKAEIESIIKMYDAMKKLPDNEGGFAQYFAGQVDAINDLWRKAVKRLENAKKNGEPQKVLNGIEKEIKSLEKARKDLKPLPKGKGETP